MEKQIYQETEIAMVDTNGSDRYKSEMEGILQNYSSDEILKRLKECIFNPNRTIEGKVIIEIISEHPYFVLREAAIVYRDLIKVKDYHFKLKGKKSKLELIPEEDIQNSAIKCMKKAADLKQAGIFTDKDVSLVDRVINEYLEENAQISWLNQSN